MKPLTKDPDLKRLPIKEIHLRQNAVLVLHEGQVLSTLYQYEEGDRDRLIQLFRSMVKED